MDAQSGQVPAFQGVLVGRKKLELDHKEKLIKKQG